MKKVISIICFFSFLLPLMAATSINVKLIGEGLEDLSTIEGLSLGMKKVQVVAEEDVKVFFNISVEQVNIQIENNETGEIIYYNQVDPRIQREVVINSLSTGYYTIYLTNPENGNSLYGVFRKE